MAAKQFIDLSSDLTLKSICNPNSLLSFWAKAQAEFPPVGSKALCLLVPFATSYLCEAGFPAVAIIKSSAAIRLTLNARCMLQYQTLHHALIKCA